MMKSQHSLKRKTILLMIGPSNCGKSTLSAKMKTKFSQDGWTVAVISSDDTRRELICDPSMSKMASTMMSVSSQAFQLLEHRVRLHSSFPVNTDLIIVDSTGLSPEFRNQMIGIAKENHYTIEALVFDYSRETIANFIEIGGDGDIAVSGKHIKALREKVMPNLNRKMYRNVEVFRKPEDANEYANNIRGEDNSACLRLKVNDDSQVVIIGDVHECTEELHLLLDQINKDKVRDVIFLGDLLDKGGNTKEMIEMIYNFKESMAEYFGIHVHILRGNHERYVYKRLTGAIPANKDLESKFFQSYDVLVADSELQSKFLSLFESVMVESIEINRDKFKTIYATHAPCSNIYLGKTDNVSLGKQVNFYFRSREESEMLSELDFVMNEANYNHPFHFFGHVAHSGSTPHLVKNKVFMDTGCVHGGKLSAAIVDRDYIRFVSVRSNKPSTNDLISLIKKESKLEQILKSDISLSDDEEKMVRRVIAGGAMFISGTVAPAPADVANLDIESLELGLKYFHDHEKVIIEPKYMGSRAQVYLHRDRTQNFAISRNGFKIKGFDREIEDLQNRIEDKFYKEKIEWDGSTLIVDCELVPWHAMGSGLISGTYQQYELANRELIESLSKDDTFNAFEIGKWFDVTQKKENIEKFADQLKLYGSPSDPKFIAFNILFMNGKIVNDNLTFDIVNDCDRSLVVDPKDLKSIKEYFDEFAFEKKFEGIMIKPLVYDGKTPPSMKVRNKEYLRLIYGFDYTGRRLKNLCEQKSIKNKMQVSIDEYTLGVAMLGAKTKEERNHLIAAMFGQISKEKNLDPRL